MSLKMRDIRQVVKDNELYYFSQLKPLIKSINLLLVKQMVGYERMNKMKATNKNVLSTTDNTS